MNAYVREACVLTTIGVITSLFSIAGTNCYLTAPNGTRPIIYVPLSNSHNFGSVRFTVNPSASGAPQRNLSKAIVGRRLVGKPSLHVLAGRGVARLPRREGIVVGGPAYCAARRRAPAEGRRYPELLRSQSRRSARRQARTFIAAEHPSQLGCG
jgi:hypothetical protein